MHLERLRRLSLRTRLILNYLVVLAIGGLSTSLVGSWIVSSTIMAQARRSVDRIVATVRELYDQELEDVNRTVTLAALGVEARKGDPAPYLEPVRKANELDFLTVIRPGDAVSSLTVKAALAGRAGAATESEDGGLVLIAAAPLRGAKGGIEGALAGGIKLNRNYRMLDRAWGLVFKGDRFDNQDVGAVSIFRQGVCISTTLGMETNRAVGAAADAGVSREVLVAGRKFRGRSSFGGDWYISGYDPITDSTGRVIGMLSAGVLERAYTATRDRVILSFFAIASIGFILIIAITYYEVHTITQPLGVMAAATRNIAAGRFDQEVEANAQGEIAVLADSFNLMLKSLRQMKGDLEEWGRTLEQKVKQRTEQLAAMQARVAQSERLASIGMLAAGVAHEINNPLGGILSLTALTLEDLPQDDPNRESLEVVLKQAERCRDIVRKLLEFSRQSEPKAELLDLNQVLEQTHSLIAKQAAFHNIEVAKLWEAELPPVLGDKFQLTQVFMNIMINAVQAMKERGRLSIRTGHNTAESVVEVEIRDTGSGIPAEYIDQVFDPFFTTKESGQGTGLGLSIAYGIVTAHKGTIRVQSEPGKGTAFTVRLPVASVAVQA